MALIITNLTVNPLSFIDLPLSPIAGGTSRTLVETPTIRKILQDSADLRAKIADGSCKVTRTTPTGLDAPVEKNINFSDEGIRDYSSYKSTWENAVNDILGAEPVAPSVGERFFVFYIIDPNDAFTGHNKEIAEWNGYNWIFTELLPGTTVFVISTGRYGTYDGAAITFLDAKIDHGDLEVSSLADNDHPQYAQLQYLAATQGTPGETLIGVGDRTGWFTDATLETAIDKVIHRFNEGLSSPTGFVNTTDSEISVNNGTLEFTISPTGASYEFYVCGKEYIKTDPITIEFTDVEGKHYFYFDNTGTIQTSTDIYDPLVSAPIAIIYWSTDGDGTALGVFDERHGTMMDSATRSYLHDVLGTRYISGFTLDDYTTAGDGSSLDHVRFTLTPGVIRDDDHTFNILDGPTDGNFTMPLSPLGSMVTLLARLDGATGAIKLANLSTPTIPVKTYDGTNATRMAFNEYTGGAWQLTEATGDGKFIAVWVVASPEFTYPVTCVLGQREDATLQDAIDNNTITSVVAGLGTGIERKILYRLIYETDLTFTNSVNARLRDVRDMRILIDETDVEATATSHANLTDLATSGHPASTISVADVGGNFTAGDVEGILAEITGFQAKCVSVGTGGSFATLAEAFAVLTAQHIGTIALLDPTYNFGNDDVDVTGITFKGMSSDGLPNIIVMNGTGHMYGDNITLDSTQVILDAAAPQDSFSILDTPTSGLGTVITLRGSASLDIDSANANTGLAILGTGNSSYFEVYMYDVASISTYPGINASSRVIQAGNTTLNISSYGRNTLHADLTNVGTFTTNSDSYYQDSANYPNPVMVSDANEIKYESQISPYFGEAGYQTVAGGFIKNEGLGHILPVDTGNSELTLTDAFDIAAIKSGYSIELGDTDIEWSSNSPSISTEYDLSIRGKKSDQRTNFKIKNLAYLGGDSLATTYSLHLYRVNLILDDSIATADKNIFGASNWNIYLDDSSIQLDPVASATDNLTIFKNSEDALNYNVYLRNGSTLDIHKDQNANRFLINAGAGSAANVNIYAYDTASIGCNLSQIENLYLSPQATILALSTGTPTALTGPPRITNGATLPTVPAPRDGDRHYNTTLHRWYFYDSSRTKWLSDAVIPFAFGCEDNLANSSFYGAFNSTTATAFQAVPELMVITEITVNQTNASNAGATPNSTTINICDGITPTVITTITVNDATNNVINNAVNVDLPATTGSNTGLRCQVVGQGGTLPERITNTQINIRTRYKGV